MSSNQKLKSAKLNEIADIHKVNILKSPCGKVKNPEKKPELSKSYH